MKQIKIFFVATLLIIFSFNLIASADLDLYPNITVYTEDNFIKETKKHLGSWNLNKDLNRLDSVKMLKFEKPNDTLGVQFLINDNITQGLIKGGIQKDIIDIIKIVADNYYHISKYKNITHLILAGFFPVNDKYGNNKLRRVAACIIKISKINKINWDNFFRDDVPNISVLYKIDFNGF